MPSTVIDDFVRAWSETLDPESVEKLERRVDIIGPALVEARDPRRADLATEWLVGAWESTWRAFGPGTETTLPVDAAAACWRCLSVAGDHMNAAAVYDAIRSAAGRALIDSGWSAAYAACRTTIDPAVARRTWQATSLRAVLVATDGVTDPWRRTDEADAGTVYGMHFTTAWTRLAHVVDPLRAQVMGLFDWLTAAT